MRRCIQAAFALVLLVLFAGLPLAAAFHLDDARHDSFCSTCRALAQFIGLAIFVVWAMAPRASVLWIPSTQAEPVLPTFCAIRRPRSPPAPPVSV